MDDVEVQANLILLSRTLQLHEFKSLEVEAQLQTIKEFELLIKSVHLSFLEKKALTSLSLVLAVHSEEFDPTVQEQISRFWNR